MKNVKYGLASTIKQYEMRVGLQMRSTMDDDNVRAVRTLPKLESVINQKIRKLLFGRS